MHLPSPNVLRDDLPLSEKESDFITDARENAKAILCGKSSKLALLVGPCSIHDCDVAIEYAKKLAKLSREIDHFFLVMRAFMEKPRTRGGWSGMVYDPHLDASHDIAAGLRISRKILLDLASEGVPAAAELLEPLVAPYFEDLLTWGLVGARTSASPPHRCLASALPFPVGFKNGLHGELDGALCGIMAARKCHVFPHIDGTGRIAVQRSLGNPWTHLVLRGSQEGYNFDPVSVGKVVSLLKEHGVDSRLVIDCSHGNSRKNPAKQKECFASVIDQITGGHHPSPIVALMLESHLLPGNQPISPHMHRGVSITDSCLGWEETEALIRWGEERLAKTLRDCDKIK